MIRFTLLLITALSLGSLVVEADAQQPSNSLADRLTTLREGWDYGDKEPRQGVQATPAEIDVPKVASRVPYSKSPNRTSTQSQTKSTNRNPSTSARARMLRDMRNGAPLVSSQSNGRAGSVLSGAGKKVATDNPTVEAKGPASSVTPELNKTTPAKLAKAIAADVAESMEEAEPTKAPVAAEPVVETAELAPVVAPTEATPTEAKPVAEAPAPVIAMETAPEVAPAKQNQPEIKGQVGDRYASSGSVVSVAERTNVTKVPMFIGGGYDKKRSQQAPAKTSQAAIAPKFSESAKSPTTVAPAVRAAVPAKPSNNSSIDDQLLITQKMPVVVSRVLGPRSIVVGREATYRVEVSNRGDADANQLDTQIAIPEWADVTGTNATIGAAARGDQGKVAWRMPRLAAGETAQLDLKIIARSGQPIQLGVTWKHSPVDNSTLVEVKEPKLEVNLVGPGDVLFGKPQLYRLTLSNPGTGDAENVMLRLTPPGAKPGEGKTHPMGNLAPGATRSLDIELTARQAGRLSIEALATADGNIQADASQPIFCRKAELAVDWRGPRERYAGSPAVHYFRVRNQGTAAAQDVRLTIVLPEGFEVIPNSGAPEPAGGQITFRAGSLNPGDDRYFEIKGIHTKAGENTIALSAEGADELLSPEFVAKTQVVALADLKLDVLDPKGPVATGQEIEYQIRVTNRGTNEAREVRVVGLFSSGIEPHHVEGGLSKINDGRVAFDTIASLPAGAERVFTIFARAHDEGTHLFRAEVLCRDLDIKLAAEETTRFFRDETLNVAGDPMSGGRSGSESVFPR